jgi:geranylgeranyl diphosphate synthase type II
MDLEKYMEQHRACVDETLDRLLPSSTEEPHKLHEAMRYSVFSGGKRFRPILALATCEAVEGEQEDVLPLACAVEMIHAYSLIHDDLPAMDNDVLRRGEPTCHVAFGEALAILAGDALLAEAFRVLTDASLYLHAKSEIILRVAWDVASASGPLGMAGGQTADVQSTGQEVSLPLLEYIHVHKTGELIRAAVLGAAKLSGAIPSQLEALSVYGKSVGLAFQIADDVLDVVGEPSLLGKAILTDQRKGKLTYPLLLGVEESRDRAAELVEQGIQSIHFLGPKAERLRELARYVVDRQW